MPYTGLAIGNALSSRRESARPAATAAACSLPSCQRRKERAVAGDLHGLIAGVLQAMTHAELIETPRRIAGLVVPTLCGIAGGASDCRLQSNEARRPV